jgi:hypothetical protein
MKRFPILASLLLFPALALMVMVGCNEKKPVPPPANGGGKVDEGTKSVAITAATDGTVKGTVKIKGDPPEMKEEDRILKHEDKNKCLAGKGNHVLEQIWLVNKNGFVANVVVSLEPPEGKKYKIEDKLKDSFKTKTATLDQPYCAFEPHIVALYADVQPLVVKNSAKFTHNTKITGGVKNGDTNEAIGSGVEWKPRTFKKDSNPIPVECSMHTWMNAKLITFDHPYFAVTKEDGSFEIANVPVGESLVVYMWHESTGKKKDMGKVTTKAGEKTQHDLEISK